MSDQATHWGPDPAFGNLIQHLGTREGCSGPDCGPDPDDTRREDEPGDWFIADFDGECSRCGRTFGKDVTVRADSDGDWECKVCVDEDQRKAKDQGAYETELASGRAFGGAA